ncbi:MAG: MBL fold metallo-hydrolase [Proteobacteria bacterium]|nr:MBL fold metallo-hydrolase [Pseudomonadota bacterium]MBU1711330.1 MBL fold metallo-hydrolase [Pseudomonadota bacterium]
MKITEHIHAIKIPFQVPLSPEIKVDRFVYAYLVYGKKICLIDTGVAGAEQIIYQYLRDKGKNPQDIETIILSHSHPDHIGAAHIIQKETGCRIMAHAAEKNWIEDVELQGRQRPVPGFHALVGGSVKIDHLLEQGDTIDLGNDLQVNVLHTPGHSSGSISLWFPSEKVLFSGDAVPLPGDMPIYEDVEDSRRSIEKLQAIQGVECLLASWDDPRYGEDAGRVMDQGLGYLETLDAAVTEVVKPGTLEPMEICQGVVKNLGLPPFAANPLVARSLLSHLNMMSKEAFG